MSDTSSTDFIILGAGIAGLSLCYKLAKAGYKVTIVSEKGPLGGASAVPMGLLNPSTARKAGCSKNAITQMEAALAFYKEIDELSETSVIRKTAVFKPVPKGDDPDKWFAKYNRAYWPDGWQEWLSGDDVDQLLGFEPHAANKQGIYIKEAYTVNMRALTQAIYTLLPSIGVHIIEQKVRKVVAESDSIQCIDVNDQLICKAEKLIMATGYKLLEWPEWDFVKMHLLKGQFITLKPPFEVKTPITNSGYAGMIDSETLGLGSTYEHDFEDLEPNQFGFDALNEKAQFLLNIADLANEEVIEHWASARLASKDRRAIIGPHPTVKNLYCVAALASKGLLQSPYLADMMVAHFKEGKEISADFNVQRYIK